MVNRRDKKTEMDKEENVRRRKIFSQRRRRKTEKKKDENVWRTKIFSAEEEVANFLSEIYLSCGRTGHSVPPYA